MSPDAPSATVRRLRPRLSTRTRRRICSDGICFKTGPPRTVGVELEWLVHDLRDPRLPVPPDRLDAAVRRAAGPAAELRRSPFEPGGQLELSSPPAASLMECIDAVAADLAAVRAALRPAGLDLVGLGLDPWHPPRRLLHEPALRRHGGLLRPDAARPGRAMMCTTASVQVCLDAGDEEPGPLGHGRRWRLAHLLGRCWWPRSPTRRAAGPAHRLARRPGRRCGPSSTPDARVAPPLDARPARRLGRARAGRPGAVRPARRRRRGTCPARPDLPATGSASGVPAAARPGTTSTTT